MSKDFSNSNDLKKDFKDSFTKIGEHHDLSEKAVKDAVSKIIDDLGDFLTEKKDELCKTGDKCKDKIREYPLGYTLGALALGVVIGAILKK